MPTARITGVVTGVKFSSSRAVTFRIRSSETGRVFEASYPGFCPLRYGDVVSAVVSVQNSSHLAVLSPPLVSVPVDGESTLRLLSSCTGGEKSGASQVREAFEQISELAGGVGNVAPYLTKLADDSREGLPLPDLGLGGKTKQVLARWRKNYNVRRLHLLGLTNGEIRSSSLRTDELFRRCLANPYRVPSVPLEKCRDILLRLGVWINEEQMKVAANFASFLESRGSSVSVSPGDPLLGEFLGSSLLEERAFLSRYQTALSQRKRIECGTLLRSLWDDMHSRGWSCTPLPLFSARNPAFLLLFPVLQEEYEVVCRFDSVYLALAAEVEAGMAGLLASLLKTERGEEREVLLSPDLSPDQRRAVEGALLCPLAVLTGGPGTGKTTVIAEILANLQARGESFAVVSFTGKAVARLREVTRYEDCSTLHRFLSFQRQREEKLELDHLIVDECSMVTLDLLWRFLRSCPARRVTLVGDVDQLPPISWGSTLSQVLASRRVPVFRLTENHRLFEGEDGILANLALFSSGSFSSFLPADNFFLLEGGVDRVLEVTRACYAAGVAVGDFTVLSPYNRCLPDLNRGIREIYGIAANPSVVDSRGGSWAVGERVILLANDYNINAMNGEEGVVVAVSPSGVEVSFRSAGQHTFPLEGPDQPPYDDPDDLYEQEESKVRSVKQLAQAYSLTVHKAQGSEWPYGVVFLDAGARASAFLNKNLLYTAISRFQRAVWLIGSGAVFEAAAGTPLPYRSENLARRLEELLPEP